MDDRPLIVAQVAAEAGLNLSFDQCESIGKKIGDAPIDQAAVIAAADALGYPTPAATRRPPPCNATHPA